MRLNCVVCNAYVIARIVADYSKNISDPDYLDNSGLPTSKTLKKYLFFKCPECESPFIICNITHQINMFADDTLVSSEILYPTPAKTLDASLPTPIKSAFKEAFICYQSKAYTACTIMCRKTIEGICKEHNIENGNLKNKIQLMKDQGVIDQQLFEWADMLRLSGNDAAHDLDVNFSEEDTKDIIDFTYAIVEYIFVYKKRFEVFLERKKNDSNKS